MITILVCGVFIVGFCIIGAHLLMIRKLRKCSEELTELKSFLFGDIDIFEELSDDKAILSSQILSQTRNLRFCCRCPHYRGKGRTSTQK